MDSKALLSICGYVARAIALCDAIGVLGRLCDAIGVLGRPQRARAHAYTCVQKPPIENVEEMWMEKMTLASLAETCKNTVNARGKRNS